MKLTNKYPKGYVGPISFDPQPKLGPGIRLGNHKYLVVTNDGLLDRPLDEAIDETTEVQPNLSAPQLFYYGEPINAQT